MGQGPTLIAREAAVLNTCGRPDAFNALNVIELILILIVLTAALTRVGLNRH